MRYCTECGEESSTPFCGYCGAKRVVPPESDAAVGSGVMDGSTGPGTAAGETPVAVSQEASGWSSASDDSHDPELTAKRPLSLADLDDPRTKGQVSLGSGSTVRASGSTPSSTGAARRSGPAPDTPGSRKPRWCQSCGKTVVPPGGRCTKCGWRETRGSAAAPAYRRNPRTSPQYGAYRQQSSRQYSRPPMVMLPTIATTVWISILFGLFGLIPATMHTNQAMMQGHPTNKYWKAFGWSIGITWGAVILLWIIIAASIASSVPDYGGGYY